MEFIEFAQRQWFLFALAFLLLGALIVTELMRRLSGITGVDPNQLTQLINQDDALVIDVRDTAAFRAGHIPSARHLPSGELRQRLKEIAKYKSRPTVVYDANGAHTGNHAKVLKKDGFERVHTLRGGIASWREANLPVSKAKKK